MAHRLKRAAQAAVVAVAVVVLLAACTSDTKPKAASGLPARTQQIGGLEVRVTPTRVDDSGGTFAIAFDTHTGAPTIDVARSAQFTVGSTTWSNAVWSEGNSDDHHRTGTLRFDAKGPARGTAHLTIAGLDDPVDMNWQLTP